MLSTFNFAFFKDNNTHLFIINIFDTVVVLVINIRELSVAAFLLCPYVYVFVCLNFGMKSRKKFNMLFGSLLHEMELGL